MRQIKRWGLVIGIIVVLGVLTSPVGATSELQAGDATRQNGGDWRCVQVIAESGMDIYTGPGLGYDISLVRAFGTMLDGDFSQLTEADGYTWLPVRFASGLGWGTLDALQECAPVDPQAVTSTVNRDGTLDRYEIADVSRSVVLLANIQRNQIIASGTGTLISPDGLIVTNAHVVEDADFVVIGVLDDINDPPEFRYTGEVIESDARVDVALVQLRGDINGDPIDVPALNLPYLPTLTPTESVYRGDTVYIFGYPGIGDDYLVLTTGIIVSVENGYFDNERVPVWYRTDAEIAPGNSGGLAVNGNGDFVGIPTTVRSELETGGRLGGIRPAPVALMALGQDTAMVAVQPADPDTEPETGPDPTSPDNPDFKPDDSGAPDSGPDANPDITDTSPVWVELLTIEIEHNAIVNGVPGIRMSLAFVIGGWAEQAATVYARFYLDDIDDIPLQNPSAPPQYRDVDNTVVTSVPIVPCCGETMYDSLELFIPYSVFGIEESGEFPINIKFEVADDAGRWRETVGWYYITYSRQ
ncbi:MAG: trypsin-like serine protease [Chloroflexi bacterium]|nr:trypsin-like serine protease [Chloroflexota bacterium]